MVRRRRRAPVSTTALLVVGLPAVLLLVGCGADGERQQAAEVADTFTADASTDPQRACALLAPRTVQSLEQDGEPCARALVQDDLPTSREHTSVTVAGHSAQVRYRGETVFLALFDDGWRVTAAGCSRPSPDPAVPYDCTVEGG